jgi:Phage tail tube protein
MAIRFAGVAHVMVDGNQEPLRGDLTISPNSLERTMIAGQDGIHGYQELPRVPYIECSLSTMPQVSVDQLEQGVNVTVLAQLANGKQYSLQEATCKGGIEINARDGQMRIRWEGTRCNEMNSSGAG